MIDINEYIESGVIEEYYLGILSEDNIDQLMELKTQYPELRAYMDNVAEANTMFFTSIQMEPPANSLLLVKAAIHDNRLWTNTQLDSETKLLPQFIKISKHTLIEKVEAVIKELKPPADYNNIFPTLLYADEKRQLILVWVKKNIPMEKHPELDESFFILEGTADCYIDDEVFQMVKGDFMSIPPKSKHEVLITSKTPAKAILCRVAI